MGGTGAAAQRTRDRAGGTPAPLSRLWPWLALTCVLGPCAGASADSYEQARTDRVLAREGLKRDPAPEGKRIAFVKLIRDEVFLEDEVWPTWPNIFHMTTREPVIERELLFARGQSFRDARAEETMRNLRNLGVFALVRIVAVRTPDPSAVGVVVHTREFWSLRFEHDFTYTTGLDALMLQLAERNLLGRNKTVTLRYSLNKTYYGITQEYADPRVWGGPLSFGQSAGWTFSRTTRQREGEFISASLSHPFRNLAQQFSASLAGSLSSSIGRQVQNGVTLLYEHAPSMTLARRVWRSDATVVSGSASYRRGGAYKQTVTLGMSYSAVKRNDIPETALDPAAREDFYREVLGRQGAEVGPSIAYSLFVPRYRVLVNLRSFGQSETYRVGPTVSLSLRSPLRSLGSVRDALIASGGLSYRWARRGVGLLYASTSMATRMEEGAIVDQSSSYLLSGAGPFLGAVRPVARFGLVLLHKDSVRSLVSLGATNGLRGYASQAVTAFGGNRALLNLELRTRPVVWNGLHVGGVMFYDVGSLFEQLPSARLYHGVGLGLRMLLPQFNRDPFTTDFGVDARQIVPLITSNQAVGI